MSSSWSRIAPARRALIGACVTVGAVLALVPAAQATTLPTVSVALTPSSATVTGPLQSGAVNIASTATGVKETAVILFLLKPGTGVAEAEGAVKEKKVTEDPNNASKYGSIVFDAEVPPGAPSEAQTNLQAGQYLLLSSEGEKPVAVRSSFVVTSAASPAVLPTPAATVRSIEFGFKGPSTMKDGELVRFENEGFVVHMDIALPVKNVKSARLLVKALLANNEKQAGKLIAGQPVTFAGPLSTGGFQQETISAKPGVYVQVCFMDTQDGRSHAALGMERIIKIAR